MKNELEGKIKNKMENKIEENIENQLEDQVEDNIEDQMEDNIEDQMDDQIEDNIEDQMEDQLKDNIENQMKDKLEDKVENKLEDKLENKMEKEKTCEIDSSAQSTGKEFSPEWAAYEKLMQERPEAFAVNLMADDGSLLKIITNPSEAAEFAARSGRKIGVVYQSPYNLMVVDLVQDHSGRRFLYERLLPAVPGGAVVCMTICHGKYILLEQYRHAIQGRQYAFVRGYAEPGIPAEKNAEKELSEELGAHVTEIRRLGTVYADSGICGNSVNVFRCEIEGYEERIGYEEIRRTLALTPEELRIWITEGKITDGFTLAALTMAAIL